MFSRSFFKSALALILAILVSVTLLSVLVSCGDGETPENSSPVDVDDKGGSPKDENDKGGSSKEENDKGSSPKDEDDKPSGGKTETIGEDFDLEDMFDENKFADTVWGNADDATKQKIIEIAGKEGVEVTFGKDGSMTIIDEEGNKSVQHPDGTWTITDVDGSVSQYGGKWPDNEYTKQVPKPDFDIVAFSTDEEEFAISFADSVTVSQIKAYAEKVQASGFNIDVDVMNEELMGMSVYSFSASASNGYSVNIAHAYGKSYMVISN